MFYQVQNLCKDTKIFANNSQLGVVILLGANIHIFPSFYVQYIIVPDQGQGLRDQGVFYEIWGFIVALGALPVAQNHDGYHPVPCWDLLHGKILNISTRIFSTEIELRQALLVIETVNAKEICYNGALIHKTLNFQCNLQ